MASVGSLSTAYVKLPLSIWVQVSASLVDEPDEVIYGLEPQWRMRARAGPDAPPF